MSQKIDGNLQVPQALRSVTTPATKPGVSTDAAARPVEAADSLRLTGEGALYLPYAQEVLATLREGQARVQGEDTELHGTLQLSAPSDFGRNLLLPWLDEFQARYPQLSLRLLLGDRVPDLYRQPVDVAIRYGAPADSSLVALPLAPDNRRVLCAAPGYLAERGEPRQPDDLREHNCLLYQLGGRVHDRWAFQRGRRSLTLTVAGDRVCDDADVVRRWALAGKGLVYKSWLDVAEDVRAGRLRLLLPEWQGEATPMNLLCTHRAQLTRPVTLLRAFVRERCDALLAEAPWTRN